MTNENPLGEGALGDMIFGPEYGAVAVTGSPGTQRIIYARPENRVIFARAERRTLSPSAESRTLLSRAENRVIFARSEP
jgi:hypothetical protein